MFPPLNTTVTLCHRPANKPGISATRSARLTLTEGSVFKPCPGPSFGLPHLGVAGREPNWMAVCVKPKKKGIDVMIDGSWLPANKSGNVVGTLLSGSVGFEACPGYNLTVHSAPTTDEDNV